MFNTYFPSLRYSIITASYSLLCVLIRVCACVMVHLWRTTCRVTFLFLPCGLCGSGSGLQAWCTHPYPVNHLTSLWTVLLHFYVDCQPSEHIAFVTAAITGMPLVRWLSDLLLYLDRHNGYLEALQILVSILSFFLLLTAVSGGIH